MDMQTITQMVNGGAEFAVEFTEEVNNYESRFESGMRAYLVKAEIVQERDSLCLFFEER